MGGGMSIEMWRAEDENAGVRSNLQRKVFDELAREGALQSTDVYVDVQDRTVILSGAVTSYPEKLAAGRAARRVRGVMEVRNDLAVVLAPAQQRSDRDLGDAASCVLDSDVTVPGDKIAIGIVSGWVTLSGVVDRYAERLAAEDAVQRLAGVKGVTNLIKVEPTSAPSESRARPLEALARNPARRRDHIEVEMHRGSATLRGRVRTLAERDEAVAAAAGAPGVVWVRDELKVAR